jgi:hypothetical protein
VELEGKEKLKTKWSALEAIVGADTRIDIHRPSPRSHHWVT